MTQEEKTDFYKRVLSRFGPYHQLRKLQEECGELVQAINKFINDEYSQAQLLSELADVWILLEQMDVHFRSGLPSAIAFKRARFEARMGLTSKAAGSELIFPIHE